MIERLVLRRLDSPGRLSSQSLHRWHARLLRRALMNRLVARLQQWSLSFSPAAGEGLIWPRAPQPGDPVPIAALPAAPGVFLTVNAAVSMSASHESVVVLSANDGPAQPPMPFMSEPRSEHKREPSKSERFVSEHISITKELHAVERSATLARPGEFVARRAGTAHGASHDEVLVARLHARRGEISAPPASPIALEIELAATPVRSVPPLAAEPSVSPTRAPVALDAVQAAQSPDGMPVRPVGSSQDSPLESLILAPPATTPARTPRVSLPTVPELAPESAASHRELPLRRTTVASLRPEQPAQLASRATDVPARRMAEQSLAAVAHASDPFVRRSSPARREHEINLDRLVDEVSRRLAAELRIEQERRGIRRWR